MATIDENLNKWSTYDWPQNGDEWSASWGGTEYLWALTIYPRIQTFLPTKTILEIAPGYGRCTQYLHRFCKKLIIVDLTKECIETCKKRFKKTPNIRYFVNNGKSLDMIPDNSIDFVFSWDSLVHAEKDVLETYLKEISMKLTPNGVGFIHHSNIGAYSDDISGTLRVENPHWRGPSMSAKLFTEYCEKNGLVCICQEIVNWGKDTILMDCFSLFTRKNSDYATSNHIIENKQFPIELDHALYISRLYKIKSQVTNKSDNEDSVRNKHMWQYIFLDKLIKLFNKLKLH